MLPPTLLDNSRLILIFFVSTLSYPLLLYYATLIVAVDYIKKRLQ